MTITPRVTAAVEEVWRAEDGDIDEEVCAGEEAEGGTR
jgi:hypothetical protein